jgi:hypothetical protein
VTTTRPVPNFDAEAPPAHAYTNGNGTTPIRRAVEHADLDAERCLISVALTFPDAVADLDPEHFVGAGHADIWRAILDVTATGARPDATVVHAAAQANHATVDAATLVELQQTPLAYPSNAARYAEIVARHAQARAARTALTAASERIREGADPAAVLAGLGTLITVTAPTEGIFEDMAKAVAGGIDGEPPAVGRRDDGACAFWYAAKLNSIIGESESGKSWLVQSHCVQEISAGRHVVYLDFEKDAVSVAERLTLMGAAEEDIVERFHYKRVEDGWNAATLAALRQACAELEPSFAVVDGVTNAMQLEGLDPNDNRHVSQFYATVPAILRQSGAATTLVDHLVKSREGRAPGAIGAQHKRAGIDGATIRMSAAEQPGRNRTGRGHLYIDKDAPGWLREYAVDGKVIGDWTIHSDGPSTVVRVWPSSLSPSSTHSAVDGPRLTGFMERISRVLEGYGEVGQSGRAIAKAVKGEDKHIYAALKTLVGEGWVVVERKGTAILHRSERPYREAMDVTAKPVISDAEDLRVEDDEDPWGDQPW